jgi:pimeloyl-ACP methyl ester carboxylesterase
MNRFATSGGTMAFLDEGHGPAVVLLHGFGSSSAAWREVMPALTPRTRVVAPDLLGWGSSDRLPDAPVASPAQSTHVGELLDHLGIEECAAVGHGVGGVVAGLLAAEGRARCIVLLATGAVDPGGIRDPGPGLDPDALTGLDVPALIVVGEDDPYVPVDAAERLAAALPRAVLVLLPGCSHFLLEEAPETMTPLVSEFLRARYLGLPHAHAHEHAGGGPVPIELHRAGGLGASRAPEMDRTDGPA